MLVSDLIKLSAKQIGILGVGQALSGEDMQDCFNLLNMMLGEWSAQRLSVYHLMDLSFTADGSQSYNIGPAGKVNAATAPLRIEKAYFRLGNVDYPLMTIHAREDYDRLVLKSMQSFPEYVFLDTGYPLATLYVWPLPTSAYEVFLTVMAPLTQFTTVGDTINLQPHYLNALMGELSCRMAPIFGVPISADVAGLARGSKNTIKKLNAQIPVAQVDPQLVRHGRFNIYSNRGA
jgi:hypothetical protein